MKLQIITVLAVAVTTALMHAQSPAPSPLISAERIKNDVRVLSSDEFLGRGPGEGGEEKATKYIADSFARTGLEPAGDNGTWFQDVPLVRLDRLPGGSLSLKVSGKTMPLELGRNATLALRDPGSTTIAGAPLVFAGWGIVDPAKRWNTYEGVDMSGKVAVVLTNDPDFEAG